jgi:adenylate kinase
MRLILLGPPGSGKGTQAQLLSARHGLDHVGTGDLLREGMRLDTPVGRHARSYVEAGQLVPDDVVNDLVAEHFRRARPQRFVLDGYPRTLAQAASFDQVLRQQSLDLTAVVLLHVPDEEIIRRLSGRKRPDDKEETVRARLKVYHENTAPLVPHYQAQGLLREVVGTGAVEEVYANVMKALRPEASQPC